MECEMGPHEHEVGIRKSKLRSYLTKEFFFRWV